MVEPESEPCFTTGYRPGLIADVIQAHMAYYAPSWGFGLPFEAKLATEMSAFLARYDPARDLIISAGVGAAGFAGSITLDGIDADGPKGAHLRWFIVTDSARAKGGLGRRLLRDALTFADDRGYAKVYLTTFAGLDAARHVYESAGFELVGETARDAWSGAVGEQLFERHRPPATG